MSLDTILSRLSPKNCSQLNVQIDGVDPSAEALDCFLTISGSKLGSLTYFLIFVMTVPGTLSLSYCFPICRKFGFPHLRRTQKERRRATGQSEEREKERKRETPLRK